MADVQGKQVRLKIGDGGTPTEVFSTVAKSTSDQFTINNSTVEVNTKDSNGWRDIFSAGSIKSVTIGGSYLFTDASDVQRLKNVAMATDPSLNARLVDGAGQELDGTWHLESLEVSGETEGFAVLNVTLQSTGIVTLQAES